MPCRSRFRPSYQASRVRLTRIPAGMREIAWHTVPEPVLRSGWIVRSNERRVRHVQAGGFVLVEETHAARAICHAIPQRRKLSSGSHYRTASICRPHSPSGHAVGAAADSLLSPGHRGEPTRRPNAARGCSHDAGVSLPQPVKITMPRY